MGRYLWTAAPSTPSAVPEMLIVPAPPVLSHVPEPRTVPSADTAVIFVNVNFGVECSAADTRPVMDEKFICGCRKMPGK